MATSFPFALPARYTYVGPRLEGGQGYVYVCKDTYLDRTVAIKVMKSSRDSDALLNELAQVQGIRSKHIAQIYDIVSAKRSSSIGLVEEYVAGNDLEGEAAKITSGVDFLRILYQISCGLADIHQAGKVHRDIKPSNIRVDDEGIVKILDFGISTKAVPDAETVHARGTRFYAAPELYGTTPVRYTTAVDVFAFGVTARVLADRGKLHASLRQVPPYSAPFPSFASSQISLPPTLIQLLDGTLATNATNRPKIGQIRDAIERQLLYGKHRALISYGGKSYSLKEAGKSLHLSIAGAELRIRYDGLDFVVDAVSGDVYVNNVAAKSGYRLPPSCVITFGASSLGSARTFVPYNVSHPGVVL
jgi:eukaryotic-like serine/threonine-protein kinase